jgi:2-keto-3-deoxy-L-rhamnonate aldolase RhmA
MMATGPAHGLFLVSGSPMLAEAAAYTGIDWVIIDLQGGAMTGADAMCQVRALTRSNVATIVRTPDLEPHHIRYALGLGVAGVMLPRVDSVADAQLATGAANETVLGVIQIESREAVANAAGIARVPGADVLFIGANDLAMDLGQPGDMTGRAFDDARRTVLAACAAAGKTAGIFAYSVPLARQYAREGFRFIAIGNDVKFFVRSAALAVSMLQKKA